MLKREDGKITVTVPRLNNAIKSTLETSTQSQTLVLSLAAKLNVEPFRSILEFFALSEVDDFANLFEIIYKDHTLPSGIIENENIRKDCVSFLQTFEPSIKNLTIKEILSNQDGSKKYKVFTTHTKKDGSEIQFQMEDESAGTQNVPSI